MSEEKDMFENDQTEEVVEETAEVLEDAEETVQIFEESNEVEMAQEIIDQMVESAQIPEKKSLSKAAVAVISSAITLVVCAAAVFTAFILTYNPYNADKDGYIETIADVAELTGKSVDEVKEEYGFPKDMKGDTYTVAAINYMPTAAYFEKMQGMSPDMVTMYAQMMGIKEEVDPNMPFGKFNKMMTEAQAKQASEEEAAPQEEAQAPAEEEAPADAPKEVAAE